MEFFEKSAMDEEMVHYRKKGYLEGCWVILVYANKYNPEGGVIKRLETCLVANNTIGHLELIIGKPSCSGMFQF